MASLGLTHETAPEHTNHLPTKPASLASQRNSPPRERAVDNMTLDRSGDELDDDPDPDAVWHDPSCRNGWLSAPDSDVMRACPIHRPPPPDAGFHDYAARPPSLRAQQAIAAAERKEQDKER